MTHTPDNDDQGKGWHDFLSPGYTGPKFEEAPNRRVRRKQRRAWQRQERRDRSSQFVESLQEQRRDEPTPPLAMAAAILIFVLLIAAAAWLLPKLFDGNENKDAAPAPAVTATETETPTSTPTNAPTTEAPTIDATAPDDLAQQWLAAYLTRESPSDDAWQDTVRDHTTDSLMSEIEDTNWPDGSPFTDCEALSLDDLALVDAPPNTPADTATRWTRVANVTTTCDGKTVQVPIRTQVVEDDGRWRVSKAVEMVTDNGE